MLLIRVYSLVTLIFVVSLLLTAYALFSTQWLRFDSESVSLPLPLTITYGLFQKCYSWNASCTRFPDPKAGDCDAKDDFCDVWQIARISMAIAAVHGLATLATLLGTLFGGIRLQRKRSGINALFLLGHGFTQVLALASLAYLVNNSHRFAPGTAYGISFYLPIVSASLDLLAMVILATAVLASPPEYYPIP
ncbi:hypothetical protein H4R35_005062 [Dimargaris xerosporica]|nr:hypothetical protein H4R35_005062 [Dimargaris xerosporica]